MEQIDLELEFIRMDMADNSNTLSSINRKIEHRERLLKLKEWQIVKIEEEINDKKQELTAYYNQYNSNIVTGMQKFFIDNFQFSSAAIYAMITITGLISSILYYAIYKINILYYSTLTDFFMAGLTKNMILSILIIFMGLTLYIRQIPNKNQNFVIQKKIKKDIEEFRSPARIFLGIIFFIGINIAIPYSFVNLPEVSILAEPPIQQIDNALEIGQTNDYIFLKKKHVNETNIIIPKSKILAIENHEHENSQKLVTKSYPTIELIETLAKSKLIHQLNAMYVSTEKQQPFNFQDFLCRSLKNEIKKEIVLEKGNDEFKNCELDISDPIVFRPNKDYLVGTDHDNAIELINNFLKKNTENAVEKIYIVGLASPDGDSANNLSLSQKRAEHINDIIIKHCSNNDAVASFFAKNNINDADIEPIDLGERHQINGLSDSRSVFLATKNANQSLY